MGVAPTPRLWENINKEHYKNTLTKNLPLVLFFQNKKSDNDMHKFYKSEKYLCLLFVALLEKSKRCGFLKSCQGLEPIEDSLSSTFLLNRTLK